MIASRLNFRSIDRIAVRYRIAENTASRSKFGIIITLHTQSSLVTLRGYMYITEIHDFAVREHGSSSLALIFRRGMCGGSGNETNLVSAMHDRSLA